MKVAAAIAGHDLRAMLQEFQLAAQRQDFARLRILLRELLVLPATNGKLRVQVLLFYTQHVGSQTALTIEELEFCAEMARLLGPSETEFTAAAIGILQNLRLDAMTDYPRAKDIFAHLAVPLLRHAVAQKFFDTAVQLEAFLYYAYCRSVEDRGHFGHFWDEIRPLMLSVGTALGGPLPDRPRNARPHVVFLIQKATGLAHEEVLCNLLTGWSRLDDKPFDATVLYLMGDENDAGAEATMAATGCSIRKMNLELKTFGSKGITALRQHMAEIGADVVVQVSVTTLLYPIFAARVAPVQIFWAMKYHAVEAACIDGYITGSSLSKFRQVDGRTWRACLGGYVRLTAPEHAAAAAGLAAKIRDSFGGPDAVIVGSLGREQKLNSPPFLEAVARVMQRCPNMIFLWTGRSQPPAINRLFIEHGVANRALHIGWVDTRLWGQVLDVFADSFPLGSGLTLYQAMAAGKAAVFFDSPEAREMGLNQVILDALEDEAEEGEQMRRIYKPGGDLLYLCAADAAAYERNLEQVVRDAGLRARIGAANRQFVAGYLENTERMARVFASHIAEILNEKSMSVAGRAS